jgi:octaprenyl-diphosphate synthase
MATLIHDDVIDGAATRRGKPTASIIFGNTSAILTGDVLLAKAMKLLAEDGDLAIIRMVSAAVTELAEGEVKEVAVRGDYLLPQEDHLKILRMKTAAFTECCCRVGAMAAGAGEAQIQALGLYGHHLGMAFQIIDDILDFRGDHAKTGKPLATDFREGQATLPLILLNDTLSQEEKVFVEEKFGNGVSDADLAMIIRWMTERKAIQKAFLMAEEEGAKAQGQLAALPKSEERDVLHSIIEFVLSRES